MSSKYHMKMWLWSLLTWMDIRCKILLSTRMRCVAYLLFPGSLSTLSISAWTAAFFSSHSPICVPWPVARRLWPSLVRSRASLLLRWFREPISAKACTKKIGKRHALLKIEEKREENCYFRELQCQLENIYSWPIFPVCTSEVWGAWASFFFFF